MHHDMLRAALFAADRHSGQKRKGIEGYPYINHPLAVAELLARCGIDDRDTLVGALLHDTIEDTVTTPEELEREFGRQVRDLVLEVSDDESLPKAERKRLQIEHAPTLSERAKRIKIADKTCNVRDMVGSPPPDWSRTRRAEYVSWAEAVVEHCRGVGPAALEAAFDDAVTAARGALG